MLRTDEAAPDPGPRPPLGRERWPAALGIVAALGLLWLASTHLDLPATRAALGRARLLPWLPLAVGCYLAGHLVRGLRCRRLVSREASLEPLAAANVVVVGYACNNLLPWRLGELARAAMLAERTRLSLLQTLVVTVLERVFDGLAIIALLGLAALLEPGIAGAASAALAAAPALLGLGFAMLAMAALGPPVVSALVARSTRGLKPAARDRALGYALRVSNGVAGLRGGRGALGIGALSIAVWALEAGLYLFLLPAFGLAASLSRALYTMATTNLGLLLPERPGFAGEFAPRAAAALVALGEPAPAADDFAIVARAAFFVPVTLWGVAALASYGVELARARALARAGRSGRPLAAPGAVPAAVIATLPREAPEPAVPEFIQALTEALVPGSELALDAAERRRVEAATASFVHGQLESLPGLPRLLLALGFAGFRAAVRLTCLTSFCALPRERRAGIVAAWAYGRFAPARHLFRAARATAHLAFFEDEAVRRAL